MVDVCVAEFRIFWNPANSRTNAGIGMMAVEMSKTPFDGVGGVVN